MNYIALIQGMRRRDTGDVFTFISLYLNLSRTYRAYLGPKQLTLDNMEFILVQYRNPWS